MKPWVRRIRGAIGIGLTWGAAWFGAGIVLLLVIGLDAADVPFPLLFGLLGFLAGVTFSGILGLLEGRRSFEQMSIRRFAKLGGAGGFLFAGAFALVAGIGGDFLFLGPLFALSGAACASGSLALARKAKHQQLHDGTT